MGIDVTIGLSGILAPGGIRSWSEAKRKVAAEGIKKGMQVARPETDRVMRTVVEKNFDMSKPGAGKLRTSWRVNVYADQTNPRMVIKNLAKWFAIHTTGGSIRPKTTPRAILIPINQRARMGTKKFYAMIAWLMQNKWTVIKDGILYVRPPMNESRRGGVAAGTRIQKSFRSRFQGSSKRPSGWDIKLNEHGLTPIAIIRTSVKMRKRIDLKTIANDQIVPIVVKAVEAAIQQQVGRP